MSKSHRVRDSRSNGNSLGCRQFLFTTVGTGPSGKSGYASRKVGTYTWGTGALLLVACAYAKSDV